MHRSTTRILIAGVTVAGLLSACAAAPPRHFTQTRKADRFTPCSSAPHCVSSQAQPDSSHYVAPFKYMGSVAHARDALLQTLHASKSAKVETADKHFIHATFTSSLFGFVDDVTFIMQPQQHSIDVKSSSRIGYYDFGVNRGRVEDLRTRFQALLKNSPAPH